ncbi:J domain-containing protein [Corynebacterium sp. AOP34-AQ2-28]|uniref:J domain-containing protein n=1 Tax=Corynebacterium sp. AOP34-AQ2-28 TaxID=3457689 RepID=UPI004033B3E9
MTTGMTTKEALALFNLPAGSEPGEVTRTYRSLIRATHPDLATDDQDRAQREQAATQINVAFKTLKTFGTRLADSSRPEPEEARTSTGPAPAGHSSERGSSVQTDAPVEQPVHHPEATVPNEQPPGQPNPTFEPSFVWYGLSLAWRSLPFVLGGALLRWLDFWEKAFLTDQYADLSPSGSAVWVIIGISIVSIVFIGTIGKNRLSTRVLVVAAVLNGSFTEVLGNLSWSQNTFLAIALLVLPGLLVVWPYVRTMMPGHK